MDGENVGQPANPGIEEGNEEPPATDEDPYYRLRSQEFEYHSGAPHDIFEYVPITSPKGFGGKFVVQLEDPSFCAPYLAYQESDQITWLLSRLKYWKSFPFDVDPATLQRYMTLPTNIYDETNDVNVIARSALVKGATFFRRKTANPYQVNGFVEQFQNWKLPTIDDWTPIETLADAFQRWGILHVESQTFKTLVASVNASFYGLMNAKSVDTSKGLIRMRTTPPHYLHFVAVHEELRVGIFNRLFQLYSSISTNLAPFNYGLRDVTRQAARKSAAATLITDLDKGNASEAFVLFGQCLMMGPALSVTINEEIPNDPGNLTDLINWIVTIHMFSPWLSSHSWATLSNWFNREVFPIIKWTVRVGTMTANSQGAWIQYVGRLITASPSVKVLNLLATLLPTDQWVVTTLKSTGSNTFTLKDPNGVDITMWIGNYFSHSMTVTRLFPTMSPSQYQSNLVSASPFVDDLHAKLMQLGDVGSVFRAKRGAYMENIASVAAKLEGFASIMNAITRQLHMHRFDPDYLLGSTTTADFISIGGNNLVNTQRTVSYVPTKIAMPAFTYPTKAGAAAPAPVGPNPVLAPVPSPSPPTRMRPEKTIPQNYIKFRSFSAWAGGFSINTPVYVDLNLRSSGALLRRQWGEDMVDHMSYTSMVPRPSMIENVTRKWDSLAVNMWDLMVESNQMIVAYLGRMRGTTQMSSSEISDRYMKSPVSKSFIKTYSGSSSQKRGYYPVTAGFTKWRNEWTAWMNTEIRDILPRAQYVKGYLTNPASNIGVGDVANLPLTRMFNGDMMTNLCKIPAEITLRVLDDRTWFEQLARGETLELEIYDPVQLQVWIRYRNKQVSDYARLKGEWKGGAIECDVYDTTNEAKSSIAKRISNLANLPTYCYLMRNPEYFMVFRYDRWTIGNDTTYIQPPDDFKVRPITDFYSWPTAAVEELITPV